MTDPPGEGHSSRSRPGAVRYLVESGRVVKVTSELVYTRAQWEEIDVAGHFRARPRLGMADFKSYLQVSRKYAVPLRAPRPGRDHAPGRGRARPGPENEKIVSSVVVSFERALISLYGTGGDPSPLGRCAGSRVVERPPLWAYRKVKRHGPPPAAPLQDCRQHPRLLALISLPTLRAVRVPGARSPLRLRGQAALRTRR